MNDSTLLQFKFSNKFWFIGTGILLILTIGWVLWIHFFSSHLHNSFPKKVQERFALLFEDIENELTEIEQKQKNKEVLYAYATQVKYPFLIFQEGKLVFWSDFQFVPEYEQIKGKKDWDILEYLEKGKYLIRRKKGENNTEIIVLVSLYQDYKLENIYLQSGANLQLFLGNNVQLDAYSINPSKRVLNTYKNAKSSERLDLMNLRKEFPVENRSSLLGLFYTLQKPQSEILSPEESFLFSFTLVDKDSQKTFESKIVIVLFITLLVFLLRSIWLYLLPLQQKRKFLQANAIWVTATIFLNILLEVLNFPQQISKWFDLSGSYELFLGETSWGEFSFFSLFFNILFWGLVFLPFWVFYPRWKIVKFFIQLPNPKSSLLALFLFIGSYWIVFPIYFVLESVQNIFSISFDLTQSISFDLTQILFLLTFLILSIYYFLFVQSISRILLALQIDKNSEKILIVVLSVAIYTLLSFWLPFFSGTIILTHTLLMVLVCALYLPKRIFPFKYISSIYLFLVAIACATVGAWAIYQYHQLDELAKKQQFGILFMEEKDNLTENQLIDILEKLNKDKQLFKEQERDSTFQSLTSYIEKEYIANYFTQYKTNVFVFDSIGDPLLGTTENYNFYKKYQEYYLRVQERDGIYLIDSLRGNVSRQYYLFIDASSGNTKDNSSLILKFEQQKPIANNVYPELLAVDNQSKTPEIKNYSYAYFKENQQTYSYGRFNYENDFSTQFLNAEGILNNNFLTNNSNYRHHQHNTGTQKIVITSENYSLSEIFTNFSILLLLLVLLILFFSLFSSLFLLSQSNRLAFSTRIQLYLIAAFFLPLTIVSSATLGFISSSSSQEFEQSFITQTENVSKNLVSHLENWQAKKITSSELAEILDELAQYAELDVNIFSPKGDLLLSSQPAIYVKESVLAPYINPKAFSEIILKKNKYAHLKESAGGLQYRSVYFPVRAFSSRELLGIVSIPFFDVQYASDKKIIEVLSIIIQIFTVLFIVFVGLSFFASNILTVPLRLIRQKLQKTTLNEENEPLDWQSDDEIGLLVQEYNQMIEKLEVSKEALARSEKETAWREMARQVAHEIKNPLTPMKLTLQLMQVKIERLDEGIQEAFKRNFDTLLTQVDTLSDIATSFSSFAKMPMPVTERFEVSVVLQETLQLYRTNPDIDLETTVLEGSHFVLGDRKLMGRILTNLMLNAIQSVPSEIRRPKIQVSMLENSSEKIIIEIKDNGNGIEDEIREKIFVPNFTTKVEGSGIGLAVAKRGIEHAGGKIWFETEENVGTSFFIQLPKVK